MPGRGFHIDRVITNTEAHHDLELGASRENLIANRPEIRIEDRVGIASERNQFLRALALARYKLRPDRFYCFPLNLQIRQDIVRNHHFELSHLMQYLI